MNGTPSRAKTCFAAFAGLTLTSLATPARADRLPRLKETRPATLDLARTRAFGPGLEIAVTFPKGAPRTGRDFDLIACVTQVTTAAGATAKAGVAPAPKVGQIDVAKGVTLAAVMPEHAHGMLVVPVREGSRADSGCVLWKGLRFHMPGWWRVRLQDAASGARAEFHFDPPPG